MSKRKSREKRPVTQLGGFRKNIIKYIVWLAELSCIHTWYKVYDVYIIRIPICDVCVCTSIQPRVKCPIRPS